MPMPTIRNPFARKQHNDENQRPRLETAPAQEPQQPGGFDKVDTIGSKSSSIAGLSINSGRSNDTGEYKLSGMIDPGPKPSPTFSLHFPSLYMFFSLSISPPKSKEIPRQAPRCKERRVHYRSTASNSTLGRAYPHPITTRHNLSSGDQLQLTGGNLCRPFSGQ